MIDILLHISLQLGNSPVPAFAKSTFLISSVATINILLFASLALVIDAYLAILTKSWLRDCDRSWRYSNGVPRAREIRFQDFRDSNQESPSRKWTICLWIYGSGWPRTRRIRARPTPHGGSFPPAPHSSPSSAFRCLSPIILFNPHRPTAYPTLVIFVASVPFYLCTRHKRPFHVPSLQSSTSAHSTISFESNILLSCLRWRTKHENTDDAIVTWHKVVGENIRLASSNLLYATTSKAVGNLPVSPSLRPN